MTLVYVCLAPSQCSSASDFPSTVFIPCVPEQDNLQAQRLSINSNYSPRMDRESSRFSLLAIVLCLSSPLCLVLGPGLEVRELSSALPLSYLLLNLSPPLVPILPLSRISLLCSLRAHVMPARWQNDC